MYDAIATLKAKSISFDAEKNPVATYTDRVVYVKPRSVYSDDFYQAAQAGLRPSVVLEMFIGDYDGEDVIEFQGQEYTIIRVYHSPDRDTIELTLEMRHRNGGL